MGWRKQLKQWVQTNIPPTGDFIFKGRVIEGEIENEEETLESDEES